MQNKITRNRNFAKVERGNDASMDTRLPENLDSMQAALEKKLAQMRNFIRVEDLDSDCDVGSDTYAD